GHRGGGSEDGDARTRQPVEQRGLAHVGAADNGHLRYCHLPNLRRVICLATNVSDGHMANRVGWPPEALTPQCEARFPLVSEIPRTASHSTIAKCSSIL